MTAFFTKQFEEAVMRAMVRFLNAVLDDFKEEKEYDELAAEPIKKLIQELHDCDSVDGMNEQKARSILGQDAKETGRLDCGAPYVEWTPGSKEACLDGDFTADYLEAVAWWMRSSEQHRQERQDERVVGAQGLTVSNLIERLKQFGGDLRVVTPGFDEQGFDDVATVKTIRVRLGATPVGGHAAPHVEDSNGTEVVLINF